MPEFTVDWFSGNIPNWRGWLGHLVGKPCRLLEIGCFEGRSTVWLLENIMTHADSLIYCIDTFKGGDEHAGMDFGAIRKRFEANVASFGSKVELFVGESTAILKREFPPLDAVYVDGSHHAEDAYLDTAQSWPKLKVGGVMIFDDYHWDGFAGKEPPPSFGIDRFLGLIEGRYRTVGKGYQLAIIKLK